MARNTGRLRPTRSELLIAIINELVDASALKRSLDGPNQPLVLAVEIGGHDKSRQKMTGATIVRYQDDIALATLEAAFESINHPLGPQIGNDASWLGVVGWPSMILETVHNQPIAVEVVTGSSSKELLFRAVGSRLVFLHNNNHWLLAHGPNPPSW